MTDITPGGFADTPGPDATAEQDADVRALLGALRDADVPMPDDVWARLQAVIAQERRTAPVVGAFGGAAAPDDADVAADAVPGFAPITVLPTSQERGGGGSRSLLRWVAVAAAAVVVLGGGYTILRGSIGSSSSTTAASAGSAMPAPESSKGAALTTSGTAYTSAALRSQARALAAAALGASRSADAVPSAAGAPAPTPSGAGLGATAASAPRDASVGRVTTGTYSNQALRALAPSGALLSACIDQFAGKPGVQAIAVDVGTFNGQPALVLVFPSVDDPASLDVFVVPASCRATDSVQLVRIPRP